MCMYIVGGHNLIFNISMKYDAEKCLQYFRLIILMQHSSIPLPQYSSHGLYSWMEVSPQDLAKSRSREIRYHNDRIVRKFDSNFGSTAAKDPVKCQSDWKRLNPNLKASRLHDIWHNRKMTYINVKWRLQQLPQAGRWKIQYPMIFVVKIWYYHSWL